MFSLPSVLTSHLQRRFLSFLLKRALGRLVKGGEIQLDKVDADLGNGRVAVRDLEVEVDGELFTKHLPPSFPFRLVSGHIGLVCLTIQWSLFSTSPSAPSTPLNFEISSVSLVFELRSLTTPPPPLSTLDVEETINSTLNSVTEEFVRQELNPSEDEELRKQVRQSKSTSSIRSMAASEMGVPGAFGGSTHEYTYELPDDEDEAELTLMSSIIDRLLKNLKVKIVDIDVRIQEGSSYNVEDKPFQSIGIGDNKLVGTEIDLKISEIVYAVETPLPEAKDGNATPTQYFPLHTLRITPPKLYILQKAKDRYQEPYTNEDRDDLSVSSEDSSEGSDNGGDMEMMRSGIADLRESQMSRLSYRTSYQSFYSFHDTPSHFMESIQSSNQNMREQDDTFGGQHIQEADHHWELLCSFGSEDIVIQLDSQTRDIKAHIGSIQLLATLEQISALQDLASTLMGDSRDADATTQLHSKSTRSVKRTTSFEFLCRSINIVLFDTPNVSSNTNWDDVQSKFWGTGAVSNFSHLRVKADYVQANITKHSDGDVDANCTVTDLWIQEGIFTAEGMKTVPILFFDPSLPHQYDSSPEHPFPEYSSGDFLSSPPHGFKSQGSKPKSKRPDTRTFCHAINIKRLHNGRICIDLAPLRTFIDFSLPDRLSPLLEVLNSRSGTTGQDGSETASDGACTPKGIYPEWDRRSEGDTVLEDPRKSWKQEQVPIVAPDLSLHIAFFRADLRCPTTSSGRNSRHIWPPPLRSGVLTVDVHDFQLNAQVDGAQLERRFSACWRNAMLFFMPSSATSAQSFISFSCHHTAKEQLTSESSNQPGQFASISIALAAANDTPTTVLISIPFIRANITKGTLDGLILFADDLSSWATQTLEDPLSEADVLGSRFFTAKSFVRRLPDLNASETGSETLGKDGKKKMQVKVDLTKVVAQLQVPKQGLDPDIRTLRAGLNDAQILFETGRDGKDQTFIKVEMMDLFLSDVSFSDDPRVIIKQTFSQSHVMDHDSPVVSLKILSTTETGTRLKESKIVVVVARLTYFFTPDLQWIEDVSAYGRSPEGAFENAVPNELTKVVLRLNSTSIHLTPPSASSRLVVAMDGFELTTNLMPDVPRTHVRVRIHELIALLKDRDHSELMQHFDSGLERQPDYWKILGFCEVAMLERLTIVLGLGNGLVLPDLEILLEDSSCILSVCADSIITVGDFFSDMSKFGSERTTNHINRRRSRKMKLSTDLLSNIEKKAFIDAPLFDDEPDFLPDNIPSNLEYLLNSRQRRAAQTPSEILASSIQPQETVISNIEGETIKILDVDGIHLVEDHFRTPQHIDADGDDGPVASSIRCTIRNSNLHLHLYKGFDWIITRKRLEEQAKIVRMRLWKIRSLLAKGQTLDESLQQGCESVLDSDDLGLPADARNMSPNDLITHIDEELRDDISETSSHSHQSFASTTSSGWETNFSGPKPNIRGISTPRSLKLSARPRARKNSLEFNLLNIGMRFESFPDPSPTKSKLKLEVDTFNIVDNIKTSTWHKFLTELRTSDGGVVRATGSPMVRIEMKTVRPTSGEEVVLRVKIFPLRLHVDQDALDFMKTFFSFKVPGSQPPSPVLKAKEESQAFLQRVEIWPIKIKMDYKPKRVDYSALRQGRSIELMNFFHFEGSEMVLRHVTVNGISGWSRMGDLLQDVWTRDVKANQLSDVISGIAPIRSVVNIGTGVADLVLLPIEQYKKDGRLIRGLQKGAASFAKTTALETIKLGARLATGTQVILEQAEAVLGAKYLQGGSLTAESVEGLDMGSEETDESDEYESVSRYASQPADIVEGLQSAYKSLGGNLREAAQTILAVPMEVYERSSSDGRARAVVRAVPIAVIRPMIGATEAMSKTLLGLRNTLDPEAQGEDSDKYKRKVL